jgi:Lipocalin-like domain
MSATLGDSARLPVPAGDPQSGTDRDYEKIARHFIAYAGPFSADPGNGTVTHHIDVSLYPNWQGHDQVRRVTIEARRLSIIASDRTARGRPDLPHRTDLAEGLNTPAICPHAVLPLPQGPRPAGVSKQERVPIA